MRRAAKVDANQAAIVETLREAGASVQPLHMVGRGVPDLLVGFNGHNFLMEIKDGKGKLTSDESNWHSDWRGRVVIVRTENEALYELTHWK